ncbi:Anti-sigma-28 factor, FlgM [compost metagenome]
MKINEPSRVGNVNPYRKTAAGNPASAASRTSKKDEVRISTEAKELLSSVRNPEKLDELKKAVSTGTYQVDAQQVAEKLFPYLK